MIGLEVLNSSSSAPRRQEIIHAAALLSIVSGFPRSEMADVSLCLVLKDGILTGSM